jgi:hypothetical protein
LKTDCWLLIGLAIVLTPYTSDAAMKALMAYMCNAASSFDVNRSKVHILLAF